LYCESLSLFPTWHGDLSTWCSFWRLGVQLRWNTYREADLEIWDSWHQLRQWCICWRIKLMSIVQVISTSVESHCIAGWDSRYQLRQWCIWSSMKLMSSEQRISTSVERT